MDSIKHIRLDPESLRSTVPHLFNGRFKVRERKLALFAADTALICLRSTHNWSVGLPDWVAFETVAVSKGNVFCNGRVLGSRRHAHSPQGRSAKAFFANRCYRPTKAITQLSRGENWAGQGVKKSGGG